MIFTENEGNCFRLRNSYKQTCFGYLKKFAERHRTPQRFLVETLN